MVIITEEGMRAGFEVEGEEEKCMKHYSSFHKILLVGEGDFSFSLCLARSFGYASNIVATSLDSHETVIKKYKKAKSNLICLVKLGATVLHQVDATKMKLHIDLNMRKFDRIIFNFPHAGFFGRENNAHLIGMHRSLVDGFFKNASRLLHSDGEIHVSHKTTAPFCDWDIKGLALQNSLFMIECVDFKIEDYPGYNQKRGDSKRCDEPFPLGECCTFKFKLHFTARKMPRIGAPHWPIPLDIRPPQTASFGTRPMYFESLRNQCCKALIATFGRMDYDDVHLNSVHKVVNFGGFKKY